MPEMVNPRASLGCLVVLIAVLIATAWFSVSSPNPLLVYKSGGIAAKIVISIVAVLLASTLLQLLYMTFLTWVISRSSKRPAEDVICPGCGNPLLRFISSHGVPVGCPRCERWWHAGPVCYDKDAGDVPRILRPCPRCRAELERDDDDLHARIEQWD